MGPDSARETALRALRSRDLTTRELERRLAGHGFSEDERAQALEGLVRTGLVDDVRYARERAARLAARGAGDAFIRHDLRRSGVEEELVEEVVGALEPERARAEAVAERRGRGPKTARYLRGKGFAEDVVSAVAGGDGDGVG